MNIFRLLADLSHAASKITLIVAIHRNSSAEGVSLLTQLLYALVFCTRYLDLFWVSPFWNFWNFCFKLFYITSSIYVVYLMMRVYPRTREKEVAWKVTIWTLGACVVSAPLVTLVFNRLSFWKFVGEMIWTFSIELESVCVLPQLQLLRQTSVPTVLDSYYLVTLGSYRFWYVVNWIYRGANEGYFEPVAFIFGVIQTLLYVDFAWVYYSRQRVKLRGGGVVDSDDLNKSFLVRRFLGGNRGQSNEEDIAEEDEALAGQENGTIRPAASRGVSNWGARGISVSADSTLDHHHHSNHDIDASEIADPSTFADDSEDDDNNNDNNNNNDSSSKSNNDNTAPSLPPLTGDDMAANSTNTAGMIATYDDDPANEWANASTARSDQERD